jgi:hypothetical protein
VIHVKILSLGDPERYVVRRTVLSAQQELQPLYPNLKIQITEVKDAGEIGKYAQVLVLPTLVIDEKVVCSGRFPSRDDVVAWLREALPGS